MSLPLLLLCCEENWRDEWQSVWYSGMFCNEICIPMWIYYLSVNSTLGIQLFGDDDLSRPLLLSINHDHDYAALRFDNSFTDEHEENLHTENGMGDIINAVLSLDQNFGVLDYENDGFEVFCRK